jgi:nucleoside-diphosphate-sugar epimerase
MRAFVTGATGFLGGRLTEQLRARGHEVVALDRRSRIAVSRAASARGRTASRMSSAGRSRRFGAMIDRVSPRRVRLTMPAPLLEAMIPAGPLIGKLLDTGPNLRELISASAGVTYWATDAKARAELGYEPRSLEAGL